MAEPRRPQLTLSTQMLTFSVAGRKRGGPPHPFRPAGPADPRTATNSEICGASDFEPMERSAKKPLSAGLCRRCYPATLCVRLLRLIGDLDGFGTAQRGSGRQVMTVSTAISKNTEVSRTGDVAPARSIDIDLAPLPASSVLFPLLDCSWYNVASALLSINGGWQSPGPVLFSPLRGSLRPRLELIFAGHKSIEWMLARTARPSRQTIGSMSMRPLTPSASWVPTLQRIWKSNGWMLSWSITCDVDQRSRRKCPDLAPRLSRT
jgi:hypothetical protein